MAKNKEENGKKIFKYCVITAILVACIIVFLLPIIWGIGVGESENRLEISSYVSQIITNLFVVFGVIVALWQYIIYSRTELELKNREIYDIDKERVQRAIELSEFYKNNIINEMPPIRAVFKIREIKEILAKISVNKMIRFDKDELCESLASEDIEFLKNWSNIPEVSEILVKLCMVYDKWNSFITEIEVEEDGKISTVYRVNNNLVLNKCKMLIKEILNNLEYFSMNFNYGTADDDVVYQSLHCSYIRIVELLYFTICLNNKSSMGEQKVFTNIIKLYRKWKIESIKQVEDQYAASSDYIRERPKLEY